MSHYDNWHRLLPQDLIRRAYNSNNGELAWAASDAVQVMKTLQRNQHDVPGIEIWLPTRPGPTIPMPYFYDWRPSREISAIDYIETFAWDELDRRHHGMVPYFNIAA